MPELTNKCAALDPIVAQDQQDKWALEQLNCKKHGYYVDIGAYDGKDISNTYHMDVNYDWNGICIDPFSRNMDMRSCKVIPKLMYDVDNLNVTVALEGPLTGIVEHIKGEFHLDNTRDSPRLELTTTKTQKVFDDHEVPSVVDFLSLDTEGSEFNVLRGIDHSRHCFKSMAIEHNLIEPTRSHIREFLEGHGYTYAGNTRIDDFYTKNC